MQIRWMIRRDMKEVLAIESECYAQPWTETDFLSCLRQRNCIGMVATTDDGVVVGYMFYEIHRHGLELLNLAVAKGCWRSGIGRGMLDKLRMKLSAQRRIFIKAVVGEDNLPALLFLRACDFKATRILHQPYEEVDMDAIVMEFVLPIAERMEVLDVSIE